MSIPIPTEVFNKTLRYFLAPVADLLDDPAVREIMINGCDEIFVERGGGLEKTDVRFEDEDQLLSAVTNIAQYVGRFIRAEEPRFDARLPEGHRVHVVLPPLSRNGISVTIRKHFSKTFTLQDMIDNGTLTQEAADFLEQCTLHRKNFIVSGGTGTGKTTLLNVLSSLIPEGDRIIVIEDSAELQIQQEHVVSLESRAPDRKGKGEITIRDLLHSSLRMRPDRIVIGECRGGEALDLLQAMNTGHEGSMSTVHANSPTEALKRLETLALYAGIDIPLRFLRAQVGAAVHVVAQVVRFKGRRMVREIMGLEGLDENENYRTVTLFDFDPKKDQLVATKDAKTFIGED